MLDGSFRITLDVPSRVHRPTGEVSGRVVFGGEASRDVPQVQVDFGGIAEVRFPSPLTGRRCTAATTLFRSQRTISGSRCKIDDATLCEWPFTFSFPSKAETSDQWQTNTLFASATGSPLPPSFTYSSPAFDCKVEYFLEARLVSDHLGSAAEQRSHKCYLLFEPAPSRTGSHPLASFTRNFTTLGRPLEPRPDARASSLKRRLSTRLSTYISRDRAASVPFTVDVKVPSVIVQRDRFPCHVSVCADGPDSLPAPRIEVRGLAVNILSHTYIRTGSHREATQHTNSIQIVAHQNLDIPIRVNENVDLGTILSDLHAPVLPPSFRSYNITRRYEMKIALVIACGVDQFQFIGEVPSLRVVHAAVDAPLFCADEVPPTYDMTIASRPGSIVGPPRTVEKPRASSSEATNEEPGPDFKIKAHIFEFVRARSEWKERCHGSLYLRREAAGKTSLLVLQSGTHKVCAKHYVTTSMRLIPIVGSDRSWTWHTPADLSGKTAVAIHFAARFKDPESANVFKAAFLKAQKRLEAASGPSGPSGASKRKSKAGIA